MPVDEAHATLASLISSARCLQYPILGIHLACKREGFPFALDAPLLDGPSGARANIF